MKIAFNIILLFLFSIQFVAAQNLAKSDGFSDWQAEMETMGLSHMEVGAYLVGLWGLPNPIVEAVAFHHRPSSCVGSQFSALTAVHVANAFVEATDAREPQLDDEYIDSLNLAASVPDWRDLCGIESQETDTVC